MALAKSFSKDGAILQKCKHTKHTNKTPLEMQERKESASKHPKAPLSDNKSEFHKVFGTFPRELHSYNQTKANHKMPIEW